jgi:RNA polymerase sigma factor for flagellar operon FliA
MSAREGHRISAEEALALWTEYRESGDRRLRDRLVLTFAPMVKYIVYKKIREIPGRCEVDDFISCGLEALIRSIDRYDPSKGASLEQFAWTRIHGAVLDELRRHDWAPRSLRRRERDITQARERFIGLHGRRPTQEELADSVGLTVDQLRSQIALERIDLLASTDREADPVHASALAEAKSRFRVAFQHLPERERRVAILLYVENLTLREVGEVLGVSESRVCQIHGQLRRSLRATLDKDASLFSEVA